MTTEKDFYGKNVTEVIRQACREFGVAQEELDIEVLETGSAGIFGLCKKKAHIRVRPRKQSSPSDSAAGEENISASSDRPDEEAQQGTVAAEDSGERTAAKEQQALDTERAAEQPPQEQPSPETLEAIRSDLGAILDLMGAPSTIAVQLDGNTVECRITTEHEDVLINNDGRTLDSLQYLLRKMMVQHLPERMMLSLDVGDFRERRARELRDKALELAGLVKEGGKTQVMPALNPSERRVVHMVLQEDKEIRSRSVGEGLFKKVLIYKPGKGRKSGSRKRRGRQGGRTSSR